MALCCLLASASAAAAQTTTYSATKTIPAPPASSYAGSGGGDGWALAFSTTQVFNVFHHNNVMTVACHLQSDASPCWDPRTVTDTNGNQFATSGHPGMYFDNDSKKLYVYGTRFSDSTAGVVCIDTVQAASDPNPFCGYTALTPAGDGPASIYGTSVPMLVGTRWYAFNYVDGADVNGAKNKLLCFDVGTKAACASQPFAVSIGAGALNTNGPEPATAAIGTRLIIPAYHSDGSQTLGCFDTATSSDCAGAWPVPLSFSYVLSNGSPFPRLDSAGQVTGLCLPTGTDQCFTLSGASAPTPAGMSDVIDASQPWNGPAFTLGSRVYVPTGTRDVVECYDYAASAGCANFPHSLPGAGYMYTVNADPQRPTCIWVNADGGPAQIQNFDAYTGDACGEGSIRVLASQFVVPQEKCTPTAYKTLQIADPARNTYADGTVSFRDGNGNPIAGASDRPIDGTGTVDLSGLDLNTAAGLPQFLITLNGTTGSPGEVVVKLTWTATYDPDCIGSGTTVTEKPTTVATTLSGGGKSGPKITVPAGTAVTDAATLSGDNSASAGGTVKYSVYSDSECSTVVSAGSNQSITTPGSPPDSAPVTLNTAGTYYWVASYSGDGSNFSSKSACGDEVETVTGSGDPQYPPPPCPSPDYPGPVYCPPPPPPPPATEQCAGVPARLIVGTAGNDNLVGTDFADAIHGRAGNDRLRGNDGNDCLYGEDGDDRAAGGDGNDRVFGGAGNDRLTGGFGRDRLSGSSGNDSINGENGRDRISGSGGRDRLTGEGGRDRISGGSGRDRISGGEGRDRIRGGSGGDRISGGPDGDRISGGSGGDRIRARDGRRDTINCGSGRDRVTADRIDRVSRNCERVRRR